MQDADAQDLAQRVLMSVASAIPDWERSGPNIRFRHWLRRVAKNEVLKLLGRRPKDQAGGRTKAIELLNEQLTRLAGWALKTSQFAQVNVG